MKASVVRTVPIRVAVVDSDPLRFVGLRAICATEPDLEIGLHLVRRLWAGATPEPSSAGESWWTKPLRHCGQHESRPTRPAHYRDRLGYER